MKEITVNKNDAGQRLDKFLIKSFGMPASLVYKYLRKKRIRVNGVRAKGAEMLDEGSVLSLYINDEFFEHKRETVTFDGAVQIVYEDEQIAVLYKEEGLLSHAPSGDSLAARWVAHLVGTGEYDPQAERSFVPALCNRLDRNTKGLVIAAKTAEALRVLNDKIKNHELKKKYLCAVLGKPEKAEGEVVNYLQKDEKKNMVSVYHKPHAGAKEAVTRYRTLQSKNGLSLLEVELLTGRTHQIRATFADLGHPLLGDGKYGVNQVNLKYGMTTQALYSYQLTFAFKTDAGVLNHLNGKTVTVENVPFAETYFN